MAMVNKDKSNHYKNLRRLFLEQMVKIPKSIEFKPQTNSPHQIVLVLIKSQKAYEKFLHQHNLSRHILTKAPVQIPAQPERFEGTQLEQRIPA